MHHGDSVLYNFVDLIIISRNQRATVCLFVFFSPSGLYEFVIPEDLPVGKMGGKVKAVDRDIGENAKSTYNIIEGDEQGTFEIITDTQTQEGILRLKKVRPKRTLMVTLHNKYISFSLTLSLKNGLLILTLLFKNDSYLISYK